MKKITKRFVRFWTPGSFCAEDWTVYTDETDPTNIEFPDNAYCFTMHERTDVVDGDQTFTGKVRDIGKTYYHPDSKVESLAEVKLNPKAQGGCLIRNMEGNEWSHIVWSRWGNWPQPFDPSKAEVLEARKQ